MLSTKQEQTNIYCAAQCIPSHITDELTTDGRGYVSLISRKVWQNGVILTFSKLDF